MTYDHYDEFTNTLQRLIGVECWNIMAGAVGSMASLDLGAKVLRDKPLPFPNSKLTPEEHKYRGEFVLYIEDCPWRLDGPEEVIAAWTDNNSPRGPLVVGLKQLVGRRIEAVELTYPGLDLIVRFEDSIVLRIFPDQLEEDAGDNYSLSISGGQTYIVGARSVLRIE